MGNGREDWGVVTDSPFCLIPGYYQQGGYYQQNRCFAAAISFQKYGSKYP